MIVKSQHGVLKNKSCQTNLISYCDTTWREVKSDVPQGWVLGQALLNLFINNLLEISNGLAKFADTELFQVVK